MPKTFARDAALRRLTRTNRWLIAGSVALTGVLTEVAAQAFPGKTLSSSKAKTSSGQHGEPAGGSSSSSSTGSGSLQPPQSAPESTPSPSTGQESSAGRESTPSQETSPGRESAPTQTTPSQESAPTQESTGPVVSGGS